MEASALSRIQGADVSGAAGGDRRGIRRIRTGALGKLLSTDLLFSGANLRLCLVGRGSAGRCLGDWDRAFEVKLCAKGYKARIGSQGHQQGFGVDLQ
jgi:hypothetical protein